MNTIVMNTLNGAVTEYTSFGFQSITPTHAGSATGLFLLGGDTDLDLPITSRIQSGKGAWGTNFLKRPEVCFFSLVASGSFMLHVSTDSDNWEYEFGAYDTRARAKPGSGIRAHNLSFGMSNAEGQAFELDIFEVQLVTSNLRRT